MNRKKLAVILGIIFTFALLMGPGPGIYLVNPDPANPNATFTVLGGVPVIYIWAVGWYTVQAVVAIVAYFFVWDKK